VKAPSRLMLLGGVRFAAAFATGGHQAFLWLSGYALGIATVMAIVDKQDKERS
jgi:hypothetical protein